MSEVTNLILTTSSLENEDYIINQLLNFTTKKNTPLEIVNVESDNLPSKWYGGTKFLECKIFLGAYNHLNTPALIQFLKKMDWVNNESVQLFVKEQNAAKFLLVNVFEDETYQKIEF